MGPTSRILGNSAHAVTPVLGNLPGGLQLLPNKLHLTNKSAKAWLTVTENSHKILSLPNSDPYAEIYRVKAVVHPAGGARPSNNAYWGLVDPDLLDPGNANGGQAAGPNNALDAAHPVCRDAWGQYLRMLKLAESFHATLGKKAHPKTFCYRGNGHTTADVIELKVESNWVRSDPYPTRGFRGFFTNAAGKSMQAVLQDPAGDGDGTVPLSSAGALDKQGKPFPADRDVKVEHQPSFENGQAQVYTVRAILALCKMRYESLHP
jgi:hypothetical protein